MALRRDKIENGASGGKIASAISSRPVQWIGGAALGLSVLAYSVVMKGPTSAVAADKPQAEAQIFVPDHQSAGQFAALHAPPPQQTASSSGQALSAQGSSFPQAGTNLGVTGSVPRIGADGKSAPPLAQPRPVDPRKALLEQYRLDEFKRQLTLRSAAYSESSNVEAFQAQRRAHADEAAAFLGGAGGAGQDGAGGADLAGLMGGLASAAGRLGQPGPPGNPSDSSDGTPDPNAHAAKKDFMQNGGQQLAPAELEHSIVKPRSAYRIPMGWKIPGTLQTGINSEGPGGITGVVSQDVFDAATGRHLLIPKGSQLVGTYSSKVTQGQRRVQVAWVRINYPNGSMLDLGSMPGTDQEGVTGLSHSVDTHFMQRFGAALLASLFTVAFEVTTPKTGLGIENSVHRGVGESLTQFGINEAARMGQQPPTLKIPVGYKFEVFVTKDMTFKAPYDDGIERSRRR